MSSPTNNDYLKWCKTTKIELKEKSKVNAAQRITAIEKIVNSAVETTQSSSKICFSISNEDKIEIMTQIENKIESWPGVSIETCKNKEKKNFQSYQATARNWFNRNKAKIYGNHLFYKIIFDLVLNYCVQVPNITIKEKITLFIEIFEVILSEPVQFPRTKLQPLLPHQTLMQPNKFKKASKQFINFYNIKWIITNNHRDRDRAKKIHCWFIDSLRKIKQKKIITEIPYPFHLTNTNMNSNINSNININRNRNINENENINSNSITEDNKPLSFCYFEPFNENDYYDQCYNDYEYELNSDYYNENNNHFNHFNNFNNSFQTPTQSHQQTTSSYYAPSRYSFQSSQIRYSPITNYQNSPITNIYIANAPSILPTTDPTLAPIDIPTADTNYQNYQNYQNYTVLSPNTNYQNDENNSFVFSDISSPTPLLGGFL